VVFLNYRRRSLWDERKEMNGRKEAEDVQKGDEAKACMYGERGNAAKIGHGCRMDV